MLVMAVVGGGGGDRGDGSGSFGIPVSGSMPRHGARACRRTAQRRCGEEWIAQSEEE